MLTGPIRPITDEEREKVRALCKLMAQSPEEEADLLGMLLDEDGNHAAQQSA